LIGNCAAQPIWIADAHFGDRKRFIVRADEKLSAFLIAIGNRRSFDPSTFFRDTERPKPLSL